MITNLTQIITKAVLLGIYKSWEMQKKRWVHGLCDDVKRDGVCCWLGVSPPRAQMVLLAMLMNPSVKFLKYIDT